MKRRVTSGTYCQQAFTLAEMIISASLGTVLMAGLIWITIGIQQSIKGTDHYLTSTNNGNRLVDYVARDLRRAVGVSTLSGGTYTPVKNATSFSVSDTTVLAINVPDVYASNVPNNSAKSSFKLSRYHRSTLNTEPIYNTQPTGSLLNGVVPYAEAISRIGSKDGLRYAPAAVSTGQIQVRYSRGPRSPSDPTLCVFRAEYPVGSNTPFAPAEEIANQVISGDGSTNLTVTVPNLGTTDPGYGRTFHLESSFTPRYRHTTSLGVSASQNVTVTLRNQRRD